MWSDLPTEIWTNVFDVMKDREEGINASMACKTLNEAWYRSRHWSAKNPEVLYLLPDITNDNLQDTIRMFEKINWNVQYLIITLAIFPKIFAKRILRNLKNTKKIFITFANRACVDLTVVVKNLPPSVTILHILAYQGWSINDKTSFPNTLEELRMDRREFPKSGHQKHLEGNLRDLVIAECSAGHVLKTCCLKPLVKLEYLWLTSTNEFGSVDLPLNTFPVLKRIGLANATCSILFGGSELHVLGFATKKNIQSMAQKPWEELLDYVQFEPREDKNVHVFPENEEEYTMPLVGQSMFINEWKTHLRIFLNVDRSSVRIIGDDIRKKRYYYNSDDSD
jgi:hypothetical protein